MASSNTELNLHGAELFKKKRKKRDGENGTEDGRDALRKCKFNLHNDNRRPAAGPIPL